MTKNSKILRGGVYPPVKQRDSNLELFRIITMLLIVASHYVVYGASYDGTLSWRFMFMLLFGAWGKTGINCFVLITGYFMCKSQITLKKFLKLVLEICFYSTAIYLVFALVGYTNFSLKSMFLAVIPFARTRGSVFVTCYPIFYLSIPFLNALVQNISEKTHFRLVVMSIAVFSIWASVPTFEMPHEYILWFPILYFIASYIRLHPKKIFDNTKFWGIATAIIFLLAFASVICMTLLAYKFNKLNNANIRYYPYWFIYDSNKILALAVSVSAFLFFKNLKVRQSRFINAVAASTFGVLLLHDGCGGGTIAQWLWYDVLKIVDVYNFSPYLVLHAIGSVLAVYIICTVIDQIRILLLEKPFFWFYDRHYEKISAALNKVLNKVYGILHIS